VREGGGNKKAKIPKLSENGNGFQQNDSTLPEVDYTCPSLNHDVGMNIKDWNVFVMGESRRTGVLTLVWFVFLKCISLNVT
jgi:hypothetical protein